jgi:HD-GYP domain-containing protein (c-di-GMP phosphodiesterase class II)
LIVQNTGGRFYFQGEKLLYKRVNAQLVHQMLDFFERRKLQEVHFRPSLRTAALSDITAFARILHRSLSEEDPLEWIIQQVKARGLSWVEVVEEESRHEEDDLDMRVKARTMYSYALSSVKEVAHKLSLKGLAGVRKVRRITQNMVDLVFEDEALFMGLSTLKDYDDYTFTHSVNVAVLSVSLGRRLGLSRNSLENLAISGLFHDLGKLDLSKEILNKAGDLTDDDWVEIRRHPLESVRQILGLRAPSRLKSRVILAPFEHHLMCDFSGYPNVKLKKNVSLFGRILSIADVYDAMTSPRSYRENPLSPDQALRVMEKKAGTAFDPNLLQVFINMMGLYPVGTIVQLNTGETGVVMDYPSGFERTRPRVVLLQGDGRGGLERGDIIDLSDLVSNGSRRTVVRGFNPSSFGIKSARFLF